MTHGKPPCHRSLRASVGGDPHSRRTRASSPTWMPGFTSDVTSCSPRDGPGGTRSRARARSASSPRPSPSGRTTGWSAPVPPDLVDRRVEITGPTEPKMAINALNSGARVWLADLEDANTPHWRNVVGGQLDVVRRGARPARLHLAGGQGVRRRRPRRHAGDPPEAARLALRRGAPHPEDGAPVVGGARRLRVLLLPDRPRAARRGERARPLLVEEESHLEARLWNDASPTPRLRSGSARLDPDHGADRDHHRRLEMDEILHELRDHVAGLDAGRRDNLFSIIKNFRDARRAIPSPTATPSR